MQTEPKTKMKFRTLGSEKILTKEQTVDFSSLNCYCIQLYTDFRNMVHYLSELSLNISHEINISSA